MWTNFTLIAHNAIVSKLVVPVVQTPMHVFLYLLETSVSLTVNIFCGDPLAHLKQSHMLQPSAQVMGVYLWTHTNTISHGVMVLNISHKQTRFRHPSDMQIENNAPCSPYDVLHLLSIPQHSDAIRCQNRLPLCHSNVIQNFLSFQDCCCCFLQRG